MKKLARTDYKKLAPYAMQFAWFVVILLAIVAFTSMGVNTNEATRWIAIGPIQFQPSELAKPAFALVLACAFKNDAIIFDKGKSIEKRFCSINKQNINCIHCGSDCTAVEKNYQLTTAECMDVIDDLSKLIDLY